MAPAIAVAALGGLLLGVALDVLARRLAGAPLAPPWGAGAPRRLAGGPPAPPSALPPGARASAARRAIVAAVTAGLFGAIVAVRHDEPTRLVLGLVLAAFLVPLALVDLDERRLPNVLTAPAAAPAAALAVALGLALDPVGELERVAAGAAAGGFLLAVALARPRGMGLGDVKLAAVLGLFLGREVAVALLVALVTGVVLGATIIARKGAAEGRRTAIAFGPFLALGGIVAVLAGDVLVDAYVATY